MIIMLGSVSGGPTSTSSSPHTPCRGCWGLCLGVLHPRVPAHIQPPEDVGVCVWGSYIHEFQPTYTLPRMLGSVSGGATSTSSSPHTPCRGCWGLCLGVLHPRVPAHIHPAEDVGVCVWGCYIHEFQPTYTLPRMLGSVAGGPTSMSSSPHTPCRGCWGRWLGVLHPRVPAHIHPAEDVRVGVWGSYIHEFQPTYTLPRMLGSVAWLRRLATCCSTVRPVGGRRARISWPRSPIRTRSMCLKYVLRLWPRASSSLQESRKIRCDRRLNGGGETGSHPGFWKVVIRTAAGRTTKVFPFFALRKIDQSYTFL